MTSKKITIRVLLPDGGMATRTTERAYSHVVCATGWHSASGNHPNEDWGELVPVRWAGRPELARKQVAEMQKNGYVGVTAIPVPGWS